MVKIIFIIDGNEDDRNNFREAFLKCNPNLKLLFATDGVEALDLLRSDKTIPDAIFLAYNMSRTKGIECFKELKRKADIRNIPVVMYPTSGDREEEKVIRRLRASYYMRKTTSFDELWIELRRLLDEMSAKRDTCMERILASHQIIAQCEKSVEQTRTIINVSRCLIAESMDLLAKTNDLSSPGHFPS